MHALSEGKGNIRVIGGQKRAIVEVEVKELKITDLSIVPQRIVMEVGEEYALRASLKDQYGREVPFSPIWRITSGVGDLIHEKDNQITLKAIEPGRIVVEVASDHASAIATVEVTSRDTEVTYMFDGDFASGSGAEDDPYLVATAKHLDNIREHLDKHFKQVADIDLVDYRSGKGRDPIGTYYGRESEDNIPFTGSFDGNGYKISNLLIDRTDRNGVGLFAYVEEGALLTNITLQDIDVKGGSVVGGLVGTSSGTVSTSYLNGLVAGIGSNVGGLVGQNINGIIESCSLEVDVFGREHNIGGLTGLNLGGIINDCSAQGSVKGDNVYVGGLVGLNTGKINNSNATMDVTGWEDITGGFVGFNTENGSIANCYAVGSVYGNTRVGGLVGSNSGSFVERSYAKGVVEGTNFVGGLIGWSRGPITQCYAKGDVKGNRHVGGLIGLASHKSTIRESFSISTVSGDERVGGLIGDIRGESGDRSIVELCYFKGKIYGRSDAGGLFGHVNQVDISYCYSAGNTESKITINGFIGAPMRDSYSTVYSHFDKELISNLATHFRGANANTTNEMKRQSTYERWDFIFQWGMDEEINEGYPYLRWQVR